MAARTWLRLVFSFGLVLVASLPIAGQDRDRDRNDDDDRRDRGERRFDPTEILKRMDANSNGQLEPNEISDRGRGFIERYASQAGLDPKQPLPIDKLTAAMQQGRDNDDNDRNGDSKSESSTPAPMTTTTPQTSTPSAAAPAATSSNPPLVPGFGVEVNRSLPPGFGTAMAKSDENGSRRSYNNSGSSSSRDRGGSSGSSSSSSRSEAAQKVRRYAEGLLKQYDENKNGVLEKDEWRRMKGDPEKADQNKDNIITLDELADRLANYSNDSGSSSSDRDRDRGDRDRSDRDRSRSSRDDDKDKEARKSYRFLTPVERLPKGLPTWFTRNDGNGDGQVSMAEYSTSYNDTTVAEFAKYDLDGDGMITPGECLQAEAAAKSTAKTSSSSSGSPPSSFSRSSRP